MSQESASQRVVTLPDGSELAVEDGATVADVAHEIGPGLGRDCVAGVVDGDLVAAEHPVPEGVTVEIVTEDAAEYRRVVRHTAAHVLAQAVERLFDDVALAIGPPTDEGFYYDFDGIDVDGEDLERIEAEMGEIIAADHDVVREAVSRERARERLQGQPYKLELLAEYDDDAPITFYRQGDWADLCAGPHVASTGEIGAVTLEETAGAYWRGDEDRAMLTRIYGTAFESGGALEAYRERKREAERRDHRRIGREMDLFSVPEHSPGCVHFHPAGTTIRRELEQFVRPRNEELGYEEVRTPELNTTDLWKTSGHYEHFCAEGEMFVWEQDGTGYGLKPMNCANHASLYQRERRSYRELPIRYAEFGTVYRNERSGSLSGLLRVRGFTQDDGHAFVARDGIEAEVRRTLDVIDELYEAFDLDVHYVLETRPADSFGDEALWDEAEAALREALAAGGRDYDVAAGDGAFYGPKVGFDVEDAIGREWTIGTVQLDFVQPERFDLVYVDRRNEERRPVMIHRALLGSFERFLGFITEHFAGNFPLWLAPEQVRVLPLGEDVLDYAEAVAGGLRETDVRGDVVLGDDTLQRRIRAGHDDRVPYMVIVGSDEAEAGTISVRDRQEREERGVDPDAFREHLRAERDGKRVAPDFLA
jgi:threonyl-tRNA synthetase